jgi:serine/threonine-protein kinase
MGAVYEGQNTAIGKRVALKFIDAEYAGNADIIGRFQREAEAASVVESAHIVHVFDSGTTERGIPYIVMELLQGEDLRSRIKREGKLPPGEAVHVAVQMLRGLHRAHAAGIIHRDLKPDNVFLVDRDDDPLFAKIVDFGISKMMTRPDGVAVGTVTRQGIVLGTPYYMSPEQAQGVPDLDGRTDLWSTGAILFECLAGRPPFQGDAYEPIIVAVCTTDAPDIRSLNPAVSERLARVVQRALTRDRERRFACARDMLEALEATGLARSSNYGAAVPAASSVDTAAGSQSAPKEFAAPAEASAGTRVSWTQPDGRGGAVLPSSGAGGMLGRRRGLLGLGLVLMVATFAATFAWLRVAPVGTPTPSVTERSTSIASAFPKPIAPEPTATRFGASPTSTPEERTAPEPSAAPHRTVPAKKRPASAAPSTAAPLAQTTASPAAPPKPGVAGGLHIKTTYP